MLELINDGIKLSPMAFKIGECAILGMLYEVSSSPSPGLVSPSSMGSHKDMNYFTFLQSSAAIAPAMYICAQIGMDYDDDILMKIRSVGIHAEKNMFKATKGVNTQRGLLFLAGVVASAAGNCRKNYEKINRYNISSKIKSTCGQIVDKELNEIKDENKLTNGEKLFKKYGFTGVRGEVQDGLPNVLGTGIVSYEESLLSGLSTENALIHSLISLMSKVIDTTVVNRCGLCGLNLMKKMANEALSLGSVRTKQGREYIKKMDAVFIENNISPGGVADLLAISVMIYELEKIEG